MTTPRERQKGGKALRQQVPRSSHGTCAPGPDRPDPIGLLQAQDVGRLEYLLPIKYGRMVESPFAFLRGSAAVMAADLAPTPVSGLQVQLCGDAHLANFGVFATPERNLVFDINDFDETHPGPWEWDLKRLAASAVVAGRENGFADEVNRRLAMAVSRTYLAVCSACLARAHARTGDSAGIAGYAGKGKTLDKAIAVFAMAYADRTERDRQALVEAVASGRIMAEMGV